VARGPRRATGPKRPRKPASSTRDKPPLERSYAQKIRADRVGKGPSYASKAARANFWAGIQAQQAGADQNALDEVSSAPPIDSTPLATANIHQATLQTPYPVPPGSEISIPGLDASGFVPPPPTGG
jgi:hypothetical protein